MTPNFVISQLMKIIAMKCSREYVTNVHNT